MLNASEKIATPPDMKMQKPLHGKKGNLYPQLLKLLPTLKAELQ